jgi:hypothetical protein
MDGPSGQDIEEISSFNEQNHTVCLSALLGDVENKLALARQMLRLINQGIEKHTDEFRAQAAELIRTRRSQVANHTTQFEQKMAALGITVKKRPGATEPVNVQVKRNVQLLRTPPLKAVQIDEPFLTSDAMTEIVALINQSGRGFETAPGVYSKLGEEDLRTIILGHLNAVFASSAATGETFSVAGHADIVLNAPGGAVLIVECHYWDGAALYAQKIEQLFSYLTWRHTVAAMITFSRRRSLTGVMEEADRAIQEHQSYRSGFVARSETYRVSAHEHPTDPAKTVEVHHLLFNLASS